MSRDRSARVVRRFALVTLVLPAALTTVGLLVQLVALPHAPARIPLYLIGSGDSGASGGPTGWEPVWLSLILTVVLGFGLPAVFGLSSLPSLRRGDRSPTFRLFGAQTLGLSALLTTVTTALLLQSIRTISPDQGPVSFALITGLAVGVAAAVAGWYLQPKVSRPAPERAVIPLELAPGERAAWMRATHLPLPAVAVITTAATIVAIKAGFGWVSGDRDGIAAILTMVALLLLAVLATTAAFRVRVDTHGLSVHSILGFPRFRVALQDVGSAAVVDARSLGVPGSWGIRARRSRVTIVMRSTKGIRVTRRDGRIFFVTVDDAATGAALLEALAARVLAPRRPAP